MISLPNSPPIWILELFMPTIEIDFSDSACFSVIAGHTRRLSFCNGCSERYTDTPSFYVRACARVKHYYCRFELNVLLRNKKAQAYTKSKTCKGREKAAAEIYMKCINDMTTD